jgi:hypothetical protein
MNISRLFKPACLSILAVFVMSLNLLGAHSQAAVSTDTLIRVEFTHAALSPSHWILEMHPDGRAHFHSDFRAFNPNKDDPSLTTMPVIDNEIHLTPEFVQLFFSTAHERHFFNIQCESHDKVAFQGNKKITYSGPDGTGSCLYNFSTDKRIQDLGDSAIALAASIVEGVKLKSLAAHDRLGLDREMEYVTDAVKDGRMQQIGVIHDELESLASDDSLLERVRRRARLILTKLALNGPAEAPNLDETR